MENFVNSLRSLSWMVALSWGVMTATAIAQHHHHGHGGSYWSGHQHYTSGHYDVHAGHLHYHQPSYTIHSKLNYGHHHHSYPSAYNYGYSWVQPVLATPVVVSRRKPFPFNTRQPNPPSQ